MSTIMENPEGSPLPKAEGAPSPPRVLFNRYALGMEVIAVLSIGVIPNLWIVVTGAWLPPARWPYWLDALDLTVRSACTSVAVLYLISRSGEPWSRFGITRPRWADLFLALIPLLAAECLGIVYAWLFSAWPVRQDIFPPFPGGAEGYGLLVLKYAANGFAEELVTRAYLITRFQDLLKSRVLAVLLSAALFASYHLYQGFPGVVYPLMFGTAYGVFYVIVRRLWPVALGHMAYNIRVDLMAPV